jgi:hypothetical protein
MRALSPASAASSPTDTSVGASGDVLAASEVFVAPPRENIYTTDNERDQILFGHPRDTSL